MKVIMLYRSNSDHERLVLEYEHDYEQRTGKKLEMQDVNRIEGDATATLYDVMEYPTILAIANDGQLLKSWHGTTLPLINDIEYYTLN